MALVYPGRFVLSRNARGRPTLQHMVEGGDFRHTVCGLDISGWSRVWQDEPLGLLLCRRCKTHI